MIDEVSPENVLIGDRLLLGLIIISGPGVSWTAALSRIGGD